MRLEEVGMKSNVDEVDEEQMDKARGGKHSLGKMDLSFHFKTYIKVHCCSHLYTHNLPFFIFLSKFSPILTANYELQN